MSAVILSILLLTPAIGGDERLDQLLRQHYQARSSAKRHGLQRKILATDGLTPKKLAAAIRTLELWEPRAAGEHELQVRLRRGKASAKTVWVRVPDRYDPGRAWPLVITLHGQGGRAQPMLRLTRQMLGGAADAFILAAPQDLGPLGFTEASHVVAEPRNLLIGLRHLFHIDSDHVILLGYSLGSHNAWMATVMHADCFSGVVPLASPLQVVGGGLIFAELLPNCRNTAILFCWGREDTLGRDGKAHPQGGNAEANRQLSASIRGLGFDHFDAVELPDIGHVGVVPPPELLAKLLLRTRESFPKHVRQTYRLADQSRAYWLAADQLQGKPLPNGELKIPVKRGEDPRAAQRAYIIGRLGLVEGRRDGQTIGLTTRRTARVILLLSDAMIDLDRPVTILRNRKKRYEGRIRRDLRVMLEEAARDWDFNRLYAARVVVPLGGKVKFGYPSKGKGKRRHRR